MKPKIEVRVFIDQANIKQIDWLIDHGKFTTRSEAVREMVRDWLEGKREDAKLAAKLVEHEKRLKELERRLRGSGHPV